MAKGKNVLTTGDVAKICNVAPRTVSKWFDNGQLRGYRIPGSKDRRIPMGELNRFMKAHNMPTMGLVSGKTRIIIVDSNENTALTIANTLRAKIDYDVQIAQNEFEAGSALQKCSPHVVLVNLLDEGINATAICESIRADEELQTIKIIAIANHRNESESVALLKKGFDGHIPFDGDAATFIRKIEEVTAIIY